MRLVALLAAFLVGLGVLLPRALPTSAQTRLKVVSTVAPITNIVQNVGGTRIDLEGIIPPGVDSHTFEPAPGDARKLAGADLIVVNGLAPRRHDHRACRGEPEVRRTHPGAWPEHDHP